MGHVNTGRSELLSLAQCELQDLSSTGSDKYVTPKRFNGLAFPATVLLWAAMNASIVGVAGVDYQCAQGGDLARLLWYVVHALSVILKC